MIELKDFVHLPQVDTLFERIVNDRPGLVLITGFEPRVLDAPLQESRLQPSGRATIFGILLRQLLTAHASVRALVVAEVKGAIRISRQHRQQVEYAAATPSDSLSRVIAKAIRRRAGLVIFERLTAETAPLALETAQRGVRVLAQFDTIFRGAEVARQLRDLGISRSQLAGLAWIVAVQRFPTLCPTCKQPQQPDLQVLADLRLRYPELSPAGPFFREVGCADCQFTGRRGDIAAFDIFRAPADVSEFFQARSILPLERYMLELAAQGYLPVDDMLHLDAGQFKQTFRLLNASEAALAQANTVLHEKLTELEIANRVLQQQTEASISLQEIGHALITLTDLKELANYICRKAGDLCGADRVILYRLRSDDTAEILAVNGWESALVQQHFDAAIVFGSSAPTPSTVKAEAAVFNGWPPGIPPRHADVEGAALRAGLRVPLVAQHEVVGLLIFHSTRKARFLPREVALLQTFANTSALAIQRAQLIESLREKIERLETAQREIAKKERLERELEIARQVQQSMLPKIFPLAADFTFAARSEPARQVGGDLYDVFLLDGDKLGIVIADVSDKGLPAALFMALTRSLLLAEGRRTPSPYLVLNRVHRLLLELSQPTMFVTAFYGVIDTRSRKLTYVRAGHERPLLLRDGEALPLPGEGTVIGLLDLEELRLEEKELNFQSGDRLILYTDGVIDALSRQGLPYGLDRLVRSLEAQPASPLDDLCAAVFAQVNQHQEGTEQYDDMTILAVEVK